MSKSEATEVAVRRLAELLNEPDCVETTAPSGKVYQVEIEAFWDDSKAPNGNLRVWASVGSWLMPPSESFVIAPDGSFIGE